MSDIDVIKENVQFEQLIRESNSNCVLKDEYLIPDTHPDVQEILTVESRPIITNKEIVGDKIALDVKVEYTVLYLAREEGLIINSVNYTQKFTSNIDLNQDEHKVICEAECKVEHIEAAIMNERKILIQGIFDIDWELYKTNEFEFVKEIEGNDDVEVLKKTETINRISANKELQLTGKSVIRVGMDKSQISKILNCGLLLHKKEVKIVDDKIYLGCYCKLNILYKGDDTKDIISMQDDIYLSKEEEIPGITVDMIPSVSFEILDDELMLEEDDLGEVRVINNELTVKANIKIFSQEKIDTIKDAYCPDAIIGLKKEKYELGVLQGANSSETLVKDNIQLSDTDLKPDQIIHSNASVILTDKSIMTDKILIEGIIKADVLYKTTDEEKNVSSIKAEIPFSSGLDISGASEGMKSIIRATIENVDATIEGNSIAVKVNVILSGKIMDEITKEFIYDVVEEEGEKPEKKASITIYVVSEGETLWKLAKKYNTTVNELIKINGLDESNSIECGQKLIIPGRAIF